MRSSILASLITSAFIMTSCGPVVDTNAIDRQKVSEDVAKMEAVSGTYNGVLTSKKTGEVMGSATLFLTADSAIYSSPSDLRSQLRPILRATMDVQLPERKLSVSFNESYFDSETHQLQVTYNPILSKVTGEVTGFTLKGKHQDDAISGEMHAIGFPKEGLKFNLKLNAPVTEMSSPLHIEESEINVRDFTEKKYAAPSRKPLLILTAHSGTHEEELARILLPHQTINVSYVYDDITIVFQNSRWNNRSGRLIGEARMQIGYQTIIGQLECNSIGPTSGRLSLPESMNCTVSTNNRGQLIKAVFQAI